MQFNLETHSGIFVRSFSPGELRVNDQSYDSPVVLTPETVIDSWSPPSTEALSIADFSVALDEKPELILFGSGRRQIFPPNTLIVEIMRAGVGFEAMDTGAACRTFNILVAEGRRVVALLLV